MAIRAITIKGTIRHWPISQWYCGLKFIKLFSWNTVFSYTISVIALSNIDELFYLPMLTSWLFPHFAFDVQVLSFLVTCALDSPQVLWFLLLSKVLCDSKLHSRTVVAYAYVIHSLTLCLIFDLSKRLHTADILNISKQVSRHIWHPHKKKQSDESSFCVTLCAKLSVWQMFLCPISLKWTEIKYLKFIK